MCDLHIILHCALKIYYYLLITGHQLGQRGKTPHWHHHGLSCLPWWCVEMGWESCGPTWFVCTADTHLGVLGGRLALNTEFCVSTHLSPLSSSSFDNIVFQDFKQFQYLSALLVDGFFFPHSENDFPNYQQGLMNQSS